jgi:hopanoid biosynthesis associated radical SAM protein HpnH
VFKDTNMDEIDALYAYLTRLGVDGFMLSPAYGYTAVQETNPEGAAEIFLTREDIRAKFQEAKKLLGKYRMASSPIYLEFLSGERELTCTAWGNPTRNVKGWKGPCYLITDQHHETFEGLMNDTPWEEYGHGKDPRCEHCMVHCGYEPSAALGVNKKLGDSWKMLMWQLS